jgi:hypothetical protein
MPCGRIGRKPIRGGGCVSPGAECRTSVSPFDLTTGPNIPTPGRNHTLQSATGRMGLVDLGIDPTWVSGVEAGWTVIDARVIFFAERTSRQRTGIGSLPRGTVLIPVRPGQPHEAGNRNVEH